MVQQRFEKQLAFLVEADKMKTIFRRTRLITENRREDDAEHSWHFALTALVLLEYAKEDVDINHVIQMALVHDLVEVYAGDTFAYDEQGYQDKEQRELAAADKIFGLLPDEQGRRLRALWEEFEAFETKEACYANAIDRLQPFINNAKTQGHTWREGSVTSAQVYKRMDAVRLYAPELWPFIVFVIDVAIEKGYLKP